MIANLICTWSAHMAMAATKGTATGSFTLAARSAWAISDIQYVKFMSRSSTIKVKVGINSKEVN